MRPIPVSTAMSAEMGLAPLKASCAERQFGTGCCAAARFCIASAASEKARAFSLSQQTTVRPYSATISAYILGIRPNTMISSRAPHSRSFTASASVAVANVLMPHFLSTSVIFTAP